MLAVRLSKDIEERLALLAKRTDRSKSYYVKKAIEQFLEDEEEYLIASEAYKDHLRSGGKTYNLEDIKKKHDLD